jgi:hypothetical protein
MELLIPGLILVALMVYASTRIKRSAAAAFEAETVETDDFVIQKPDGFLNVIGPDPPYLFEAYSKGFGGYAQDLRLARATLVAVDGTIEESIKALDGEIVGGIGEVLDDRHYRVIEVKRVVDDIEHRGFYKLAEKAGLVYRFEVDVLAEATPDLLQKAEAMLASFELK